MDQATLIQVVYNSRRFLPQVIPAMLAQTWPKLEVVAVICGNEDGSKEYILENYPEVKVLDPGKNLGFAGAHNLVFSQSTSDFFQLVNPDLIMSPDYVSRLIGAFADPAVGSATGKLLGYDFQARRPTGLIDSTGVEIFPSGSARDRGQYEPDRGQYDNQTSVPAVSGAGCMYRRRALESVKIPKLGTGPETAPGTWEYFDEDFHSYWEDVDLGWRMASAGWKAVYVPQAVAWHGRAAGSSPGGYRKIWTYVKFHRQLPKRVRQLNYRNHILMYIKNSRRFSFRFLAREAAMLAYIILFEPQTLAVLPQLLRLLPQAWRKRRMVERPLGLRGSAE